ncbi:MAG: hypothetical protein KAI71_05185 [Candidatus Pacebacteria bacterium]|nr:hypothetical protein [Candidatus Paceibacterota bacterium]
MIDLYKEEVIDPGDEVSKIASAVCRRSFQNNDAVTIMPLGGNFRGGVVYSFKQHILKEMAKCQIDPQSGKVTSWTMTEAVQNDGAGGKPQFSTLVADPEVFRGLGWEIIAMTADDLAKFGMFPCGIGNEIGVKSITKENMPSMRALFEGYELALKQSNLINITGETAVMKDSITAFCDISSNKQLILTWSAFCFGLVHKDLLIDNSEIRPEMVIVGFAEDGYRCNGGGVFTKLFLKIFGPNVKDIVNNQEAIEFARKLTVPSISYAKTICRIIGWKPDGRVGDPLAQIAGIAHITGGGVWGKFGEILPQGVGAYLYAMPNPPEVLLLAQEMSWDTELRITDKQAYGSFHGACGMMVVAKTVEDANIIIREAAKDGIRAQIIGETMREAFNTNKGQITIQSRFKEGGLLTSEDS